MAGWYVASPRAEAADVVRYYILLLVMRVVRCIVVCVCVCWSMRSGADRSMFHYEWRVATAAAGAVSVVIGVRATRCLKYGRTHTMSLTVAAYQSGRVASAAAIQPRPTPRSSDSPKWCEVEHMQLFHAEAE